MDKKIGSCNYILYVNGNNFCLHLIKALCTYELFFIHTTICVCTSYIPDTILSTADMKTKPQASYYFPLFLGQRNK